MREIRLPGSEGGAPYPGVPTPIKSLPAIVVLRTAHLGGLCSLTTARIPKGKRKNLPRLSSAPKAIRITKLEPVLLMCCFTIDCFSGRGRAVYRARFLSFTSRNAG